MSFDDEELEIVDDEEESKQVESEPEPELKTESSTSEEFTPSAEIDVFVNFFKEFYLRKNKKKEYKYLEQIRRMHTIKRLKKNDNFDDVYATTDITTGMIIVDYNDLRLYATVQNVEEGQYIINKLIKQAEKTLEIFEQALITILKEVNPDYLDEVYGRTCVSIVGFDDQKLEISELMTAHEGKYIHIEGMIISHDQTIQSTVSKKCFICDDNSHETFIDANDNKPNDCDGLGCECTKFKRDSKKDIKQDVFNFVIQQNNDKSEFGKSPQLLCRAVGQELCQIINRSINGGLSVALDGIIRTEEITNKNAVKAVNAVLLRKFIDVRGFVIINDSDKTDVRPELMEIAARKPETSKEADARLDKLVRSVAPTIYGDVYLPIKLVLLLQMIGNTPHKYGLSGKRMKGNITQLLIASPARGKSVMIEYAQEVLPDTQKSSSVTSKIGVAGGISKDGTNGSQFSYGLLPLGDRRLVCFDEIHKLDAEAIQSLIECTDDNETFIYIKGGFNKVLPTRAAILAAANPLKGSYDYTKTLFDQIDLPPQLLSRFDFIFVIPELNEKEMERLTEHLQKVDSTLVSEDEYDAEIARNSVFVNEKNTDLDIYTTEEMRAFVRYFKSVPAKDRPRLSTKSNAYRMMVDYLKSRSNNSILREIYRQANYDMSKEEFEELAAKLPVLVDMRKKRTLLNASEIIALIMSDSDEVKDHHMQIAINILETSITSLFPRPNSDTLQDIMENDVNARRMNLMRAITDLKPEEISNVIKTVKLLANNSSGIRSMVEKTYKTLWNKHKAMITILHNGTFSPCNVCRGSGFREISDFTDSNSTRRNRIDVKQTICEECGGRRGEYQTFTRDDLYAWCNEYAGKGKTGAYVDKDEIDKIFDDFVKTYEFVKQDPRQFGNKLRYKVTRYLKSGDVEDAIDVRYNPKVVINNSIDTLNILSKIDDSRDTPVLKQPLREPDEFPDDDELTEIVDEDSTSLSKLHGETKTAQSNIDYINRNFKDKFQKTRDELAKGK